MSELLTGYLCSPRRYQYAGWWFEMTYCGPWPLKKSGEPYTRVPNAFWSAWDKFQALTPDKQREYCIGGGCVRLGNV